MTTSLNLLKALITSLILTIPFIISTKMFNYFLILFIVIFIASFTAGQVIDKFSDWREKVKCKKEISKQ